MSEISRNFANFHLGDNVYELADGIVPEIAERLDIELGAEPNSEDLQRVVWAIRGDKVLRDNADSAAINRETMADLVEASGIQQPLNRSLFTPERSINRPQDIDAVLVMGGVANWQDRSAAAVPSLLAGSGVPIYTAAGIRVMQSATETTNPNVKKMLDEPAIHSRYPSEAEYMAKVIAPALIEAGHTVVEQGKFQYTSMDGDSILEEFFVNNPALVDQRIAMVRVANAGVLAALQMRSAAQKAYDKFDTWDQRPQTFVVTDSIPVARTEAQEADSRHFQKAQPALGQLVLTAKKLHEAAGGE